MKDACMQAHTKTKNKVSKSSNVCLMTFILIPTYLNGVKITGFSQIARLSVSKKPARPPGGRGTTENRSSRGIEIAVISLENLLPVLLRRTSLVLCK